MTPTRLMIVHPDPGVIAILESMLRPMGYEIAAAADDRAALRLLATGPGLVLLGVDPDDPDALELLVYIRRHYPGLPTVLLFAAPHPDLALQAERLGAAAVLRLAPPAVVLRDAVARALSPGVVVAAQPEPGHHTPKPAEAPGPCTGSGHEGPASGAGASPIRPLKEALEDSERQFIAQALRACGGSCLRAAKALGISRVTLYKKMKHFGLAADRTGRRRQAR
jgi:DNA-binding NtrC family response regulator